MIAERLELVQMHESDAIGMAFFSIRAGERVLGSVVTDEDTAERIRSALRGVSSLSARGAEPQTPNVSETPNSDSASGDLDHQLDQCGYDPLREARLFRELAEDSMQRLNARRAAFQAAVANEWLNVFERASAAGIELQGESAPKEAMKT